jgi:hypothetical protein
LRGAREALEDAAVALAASRRPDWGEALLLAAARLVAIDESLASGRLVLLDALPADARRLRVSTRRRALAPALLAEAREDLGRTHERFFSGSGFREAEWSALEEAASRVAELNGAANGAPGRTASGPLLPEGLARGSRRTAACGDAGEPTCARRRARRGTHQRRALEALPHDLVARNCLRTLSHRRAGLVRKGCAAGGSHRRARLRRGGVRATARRLRRTRGARKLHPVRVVAQRARALGGRAAHPSVFGAGAPRARGHAACGAARVERDVHAVCACDASGCVLSPTAAGRCAYRRRIRGAAYRASASRSFPDRGRGLRGLDGAL